MAEPVRRPGRKRDHEIDGRIMAAAVDLYARNGWSGFSFEAVARAAGVGKPAVYLRWSSREDLLGAAMESISSPYSATDTGSFHQDLRVWAMRLCEWWADPASSAFVRMYVDQRYHPELRSAYHLAVMRPHVDAARAVVSRAVARGEAPSTLDPVLILEVVNGAIFTRISNTHEEDLPRFMRSVPDFVDSLVTLALRGAIPVS